MMVPQHTKKREKCFSCSQNSDVSVHSERADPFNSCVLYYFEVFSRVKSGKKFRKPKMSSISKLVKNMTKHLVKKVFDGKTTLNLEDFGKYGDYLKREYSKLQKKMDSETSI